MRAERSSFARADPLETRYHQLHGRFASRLDQLIEFSAQSKATFELSDADNSWTVRVTHPDLPDCFILSQIKRAD